MKTSPAFQFYPTDFLLGTALMTCEERGAYIALLCHQWHEGYLPDHPAQLCKLANCEEAVISAILPKFKRGRDGRLRNVRMEEVRKSQEAFRLSRKQNGSKGGRPKNLPETTRLATDNLDKSSSSPSPSSSQSHNTKREREESAQAKFPTVEEVAAHAATLTPPATKDFATAWWEELEGSGWIDRQHRPVHPSRWKYSFNAAWRSAEHSRQERKARTQNGKRNDTDHDKVSRYGF